MTSTPTAPPPLCNEVDTEEVMRKCFGITCLEHSLTTELGSRAEAAPVSVMHFYTGRHAISFTLLFQLIRSVNDTGFDMDAALEQIERNRKIVKQLSPVLKYKVFCRKQLMNCPSIICLHICGEHEAIYSIRPEHVLLPCGFKSFSLGNVLS